MSDTMKWILVGIAVFCVIALLNEQARKDRHTQYLQECVDYNLPC